MLFIIRIMKYFKVGWKCREKERGVKMNNHNFVSRIISGYISFCGFYSYITILMNNYRNENFDVFLGLPNLIIGMVFLIFIPFLRKIDERVLLDLIFISLFIVLLIIGFVVYAV